MALWGTFHWSDGTLWADGYGAPASYTAFIDENCYHLSPQVELTYTGNRIGPPAILAISAEIGPRSNYSQGYVAFIDRNETTQYIAPRVTVVSDSGMTSPFSIDSIHLECNQRSRRQPS